MSYGYPGGGYRYPTYGGFAPQNPNPLDANRDGRITQQDFAMLGSQYGPGGAAAGAALFNQLDTNRNGVLDQFDASRGVGAFPGAGGYQTYPTYPTYPAQPSFPAYQQPFRRF